VCLLIFVIVGCFATGHWTHHDRTISRHELKSSVYVSNHNDLPFLPRRASQRLGEGDHDERRRVKDVDGANLRR
jgi:hypothetical protein